MQKTFIVAACLRTTYYAHGLKAWARTPELLLHMTEMRTATTSTRSSPSSNAKGALPSNCRRGSSEKPAAAVTAEQAYADFFRTAFPLLLRAAVPAKLRAAAAHAERDEEATACQSPARRHIMDICKSQAYHPS
eukprot:657975-Pleurochrysis_carterae.AAC.2